jgi:integrase
VQVARTENGRWRAWTWVEGRRIDRRGATKREAQRKLQEAIALVQNEAPVRVESGVTVGEIVERYLGQLDNQDTAARRRQAWTRHAESIADLHVRSLEVPEVAAWRDRLHKDHRKRDTEIAFQTLRGALDIVVEAGGLPGNPCRALARKRRDKGRRPEDAEPYPTFDRIELARMLEAARHERLGGVIWLMAGTGMRTGEALGLNWSAIRGSVVTVRQQLVERRDPNTGKIVQHITEELKTRNSHRQIEVEPEVLEAIGPRKSGLVFVSEADGPVWRDKVRAMWRRVLSAAEVKADGRNLYSLRHTHATMCVDGGMPVHQVAQRLGDEPETVLKFYARKSRERPKVTLIGGLLATSPAGT